MPRVKKNRDEPMEIKNDDDKNSKVVCTLNSKDLSVTAAEAADVSSKKSYYGKDSDIGQIVAQNIMALRKTYNLSQADFAKKVSFSTGTISGVENGHTMPTVYFVYKISQVFHVPLDSLLSKQGIACYYKIQVKYDSNNPISTVFPFKFSEDEQKLMVQLHFVGNENRRKIKELVLQMLLDKIN